MLLCEYAADHATQLRIRVFATDVNAQAIGVARAGRYPQTISVDVPPQRLRRFFVRQQDPPIAKLDLVSCRNVLIYLDSEAQMRLLRLFHFALRPGGYLFLGNFEFADGHLGLFTPLDKQSSTVSSCVATSQRSFPEI
jgi:two-component system CheB/CheR fusion protein